MKNNNFVFPKDVGGWFWPEEGQALYDLAQQNKELGVIIELGSYHGKSTICLAQGCKRVDGGKVYAVDNFVGDKYIGISESFFQSFKKNIKKYKLTNWVEPIKGDFTDVSTRWKKRIRLLFIDGSHDYEEVKKDFSNWQKFVVPGGIAAFHDSLVWPGVTEFIREVIKSGNFKDFKTINSPGSLTYMVKLPPTENISKNDIAHYLKVFDNLVTKRGLGKFWNIIKEKFIIRANSF